MCIYMYIYVYLDIKHTTENTMPLPRIDTTLQRTATHCNTLQHTATHCNALQYIATCEG